MNFGVFIRNTERHPTPCRSTQREIGKPRHTLNISIAYVPRRHAPTHGALYISTVLIATSSIPSPSIYVNTPLPGVALILLSCLGLGSPCCLVLPWCSL